MKITNNTSSIKVGGLVVWRPEEWTNNQTVFEIPNHSEALLPIKQLKILHEFLTIIIEEHNSKNPNV